MSRERVYTYVGILASEKQIGGEHVVVAHLRQRVLNILSSVAHGDKGFYGRRMA